MPVFFSHESGPEQAAYGRLSCGRMDIEEPLTERDRAPAPEQDERSRSAVRAAGADRPECPGAASGRTESGSPPGSCPGGPAGGGHRSGPADRFGGDLASGGAEQGEADSPAGRADEGPADPRPGARTPYEDPPHGGGRAREPMGDCGEPAVGGREPAGGGGEPTGGRNASPHGGNEPPARGDGADGGDVSAGAGSPGRWGEVFRRWRPRFREAGFLVVLSMAVVAVVNAFVAQPFVVPSASMEQTLQVGDRILVNKLAYRFGNEVRRGDIVVFDGTGSFVREGDVPQGNPVAGFFHEAVALAGFARPGEADYTKRVVGVGGDRVVCCDRRGRLTVNGAPVDESAFLYPKDMPSAVPFDIVVPEAKLFVLGDHRGDSRDSRDHFGEPGGGMVPVGRVIGRVDRVVWPPTRWQPLERPESYADVPDAAHG